MVSFQESVDADILIQVGTVVQSNPLKLLELTSELLKSGEAATTFLLDPKLDFKDRPTL
jgi:hypothetical protein